MNNEGPIVKLGMVCAGLVLCLLWGRAGFADAPGVPGQDAVILEVVDVANKFIKTTCEPSLAAPNTVATMVPYTPEVAAGHGIAKYAVLWSGDINCANGSGTNTMNILLVEKRGTGRARVAGVNDVDGVANFERIVGTTSDTLTVEVYTWGDDDPPCCGSQYERWVLRYVPDTRHSMPKGHYRWDSVDSKPAQPTPLKPGESPLPTARPSSAR